jgi:hypothetical protein
MRSYLEYLVLGHDFLSFDATVYSLQRQVIVACKREILLDTRTGALSTAANEATVVRNEGRSSLV